MEQPATISQSINLQEKALELKSKIVDSIDVWGKNLIDSFVSDKPKLKPLSVYMKRGLTNGLARYDNKITKSVDNIMLFISDEKGNYDTAKVFDDAMSMFKDMDEMNFNIIKIKIPDSMFTSFFFGNTGAIKITESDLTELKNLFIQ